MEKIKNNYVYNKISELKEMIKPKLTQIDILERKERDMIRRIQRTQRVHSEYADLMKLI